MAYPLTQESSISQLRHYDHAFSLSIPAVDVETFSKISTFLLYGHIGLTLGPDWTPPPDRGVMNLERELYWHHNHAFSPLPPTCGSRDFFYTCIFIFLKISIFRIFDQPMRLRGGKTINLTTENFLILEMLQSKNGNNKSCCSFKKLKINNC